MEKFELDSVGGHYWFSCSDWVRICPARQCKALDRQRIWNNQSENSTNIIMTTGSRREETTKIILSRAGHAMARRNKRRLLVSQKKSRCWMDACGKSVTWEVWKFQFWDSFDIYLPLSPVMEMLAKGGQRKCVFCARFLKKKISWTFPCVWWESEKYQSWLMYIFHSC